jgi:hypothetical protein
VKAKVAQEVIELQSSDEDGDEQQAKVSGDEASYQFQTMWTVRIHNSLTILSCFTSNPIPQHIYIHIPLFLYYFMTV